MRKIHVRGFSKTGAFLAVTLAAGVALYGCGKDKDDKKNGKSIGAPAVEPPVSRNVPAGLKSVALHLDEPGLVTPKQIALDAVKELLASTPGGNPSFIIRLKFIDDRVTGLNSRAEESKKACLADGVTPTAHDIGGTLPGGQAAGMQFQCQENVSTPAGDPSITEAQLAFGLTADTFYLMERTINTTGGIVVLAKTAMDGTGTEAWEINVNNDVADFKHIKAKDGAGLEATIAGSSTSSGWAPACGIHVKSNGTYVYMKGSVAGGGQCSEEIIACLDANTGADVDAVQCTSAGLTTFELTSLTPTLAQAALANTKAIIAKKITGHIDFTTDVTVQE